jgi:hypothetical protein
VSERFAVYAGSDEPASLSELLTALARAGEAASWEPRRASDGGDREWSNGTLVGEGAPVFVSNRSLGDAARRELLEFYAQMPRPLLDVLEAAQRIYIVESDEQSSLVERAAAAIAGATGGVIVDDASGDLLDSQTFERRFRSLGKCG